MTSRAGYQFILRINDGSGVYNDLAGLQTSNVTFNNEAIDITNHGSNQWMELLDEAGIRKIAISGSGIADDAASFNQVRNASISGTLLTLRVVQLGSNPVTFEGTFKVTSFELSGGYNDAQQFSASFESSGEVTVS